ncbi:MAG TPA: AAA family ATPase [Candidatus Competibacteraceae bacterium]|nr:AAA family ATPase [Candidatus Competibacteraceae bacterium]MCP5132795.1 AAA family ATPase [Gammaproteobacteria bacterium]HRY16907.1 AAA family ATPase [Candidatus Competibacteraceae bacterium]
MRILAIRGKNLASLAGEFELHFCRNPLATAGLFAICGTTGSGKSTLLDALCLALYDETPRLTRAAVKGVSLPDAGKDTLTPQDTRNLLRRGVGEGFAEVDFVGNDGIEYCARWSVRRARGKASGKLQNTELSLQPLDGGPPIGGVKTEVQKAIRERVGLSFEQFTRAVLLAQNEFAAFLKANDNERAELLETLTGLDVYTGISIRAYERARNEQKALEALQTRLTGQQPLDDAARSQLEQTLAAAKAETTALEQRKIALENQLRWHQQWQSLQQQEQQAQDAVQNARMVQQAAAPRQAQLTQVEAVQDARPVVEAVDRAVAEVDQCHQVVQRAEEQRDEAQRFLQQAEAAKVQADQAAAAAEQQRTDASDALKQARDLDAEIKTLTPGHENAAKTLSEAHQAEAEAQKRLADRQAERNRVAKALQTAHDWLTKHQPLHFLAEDWPRWDVLLKDAAILQSNLREAEQKIVSSRQDAQKKRQELDKATDQCAKVEAALQKAESRLQAILTELAGVDSETLAAQRQTAQTRIDHLTDAERLWNTLSAGQTQQNKLEDENRALQEQLAQAEIALHQLSTDKPAAATRLEQAEKLLKIAEAANAESVETLRASLEIGSPCPVCGAVDHPYATGDAPSRAILVRLETEVDECRKTAKILDRQEATHQNSLENSRCRLAGLAKEQEALTATQQRDNAVWNTHPLAAELTVITPDNRSIWLTDQQQLARNGLAAIAQQENAQRKAAKQRDDVQQARDLAQQQHSAAQKIVYDAQTAFDWATQAVQAAQERQTECARQLAEKLTDLDAAFSGHDWRPLWQKDSLRFHEQRRQKVAEWKKQSENAEQWRQQIVTLDTGIGNYAATAADKTVQRQRAADTFQSIDRDLQFRRQQRQALFNGRAVAEVEAHLDQLIKDTRSKLQQQEMAAQKAGQIQAGAETALIREQAALAASQKAAEQAAAVLQQWVTDFNIRYPGTALDIPALHALLVHSSAWLKQEQEMLQALTGAVRREETILRERQAQREMHEQQRTSTDSAETVQEALQKTAADLEAAQDRCKEAELNRRQDDERRDKTRDLQERIVKQENSTRIWNQLNGLIGSADGKKFRNHAQQFTLDVLLGYANQHLAGVARRYRLERVPDTLALMVVDQDMGDEVRSVHSLSGGESFLVSLALALGLASLSSNRVRVESLFIDEGFGSLDADTLRVAMEALDRLQAQGRKVGVISHVQEMTERIGVQIHVQRQPGGQSRVEVRGS